MIVYKLHSINGKFTPNIENWDELKMNALSDLNKMGLVKIDSKYGISIFVNAERLEKISKILKLDQINSIIDDYVTSTTMRLGHGISITTNPHLVTRVGQTIPIMTHLENNQTKIPSFSCLMQIRDEKGITQILSSTSGSLTSGTSVSISQPWTPTMSGTYNAQIFAWESTDDPEPLVAPIIITIDVK